MPIRTDLNAAVKPTSTGASAAPAAPAAPQTPLDQLITKALEGSLSPAEAAALQQLLQTPEAHDKFSPEQRRDLQRRSSGDGSAPMREAGELHSDFKLLSEAGELPGRFSADFLLMREALLGHAALSRADKATRMFDFAVPYAQQLLQMAKTPAEQQQVAQALLKAAQKLGYAELQRQPDRADAVKVLGELLQARTPDELARLAQGVRFDAPVWPKDPAPRSTDTRGREHEHLQAAQGGKGEPSLRPLPQVLQPPVPIQRRAEPEVEPGRSADGTGKKLGPMMLWNALHRLRAAGEEGQDSAAQRDAMNQLMLGAALILGLAAILVGVLVAL